MTGVCGLIVLSLLSSFFLPSSLLALAAVGSADDSQKTAHVPDNPPVAEPKPVIDMYHGTKVLDRYRWLEKSDSPEVQKWVEEENAYTRALLDPLPSREAIHKRLTELLAIGSV